MSGCQKCGQSCYCDIDANGRGLHDHTAASYREGRRKALKEAAAWLRLDAKIWGIHRGQEFEKALLEIADRVERDEMKP
jgi:hypothetical protein